MPYVEPDMASQPTDEGPGRVPDAAISDSPDTARGWGWRGGAASGSQHVPFGGEHPMGERDTTRDAGET
jgi:hypothetical protein